MTLSGGLSVRRIGQDSIMLKANKKTDDPFVSQLVPASNPLGRLRRELYRRRMHRRFSPYEIPRPCGLSHLVKTAMSMQGIAKSRFLPLISSIFIGSLVCWVNILSLSISPHAFQSFGLSTI
jgi:hypothetical protein